MSLRREDSTGVVVLRLARPPVNAIDYDTVLALEVAFSELAQRPPATGVILTGEGNTFSGGVDVQAFAGYDMVMRQQMVLAITRMTAAALAIPCR